MLSTDRQTNQRYQKHILLCQGGNKYSLLMLKGEYCGMLNVRGVLISQVSPLAFYFHMQTLLYFVSFIFVTHETRARNKALAKIKHSTVYHSIKFSHSSLKTHDLVHSQISTDSIAHFINNNKASMKLNALFLSIGTICLSVKWFSLHQNI